MILFCKHKYYFDFVVFLTRNSHTSFGHNTLNNNDFFFNLTKSFGTPVFAFACRLQLICFQNSSIWGWCFAPNYQAVELSSKGKLHFCPFRDTLLNNQKRILACALEPLQPRLFWIKPRVKFTLWLERLNHHS